MPGPPSPEPTTDTLGSSGTVDRGAFDRDGRRRPPVALLVVSGLIAAAVVSPLVFLAIEASQAGRAEISRLLFRHLTAQLLWNTVRLTALVTIGCAVVGTSAAFAIERTSIPLRRVWTVLVVIPLAIPDFVVGYAWVSAVPDVHGLWGAALVMTLALYPLVYLPVAAGLRRTDPALEEAARSLGLGRVATFARVTLRQIRPALLGGCLVVALALLAEYGAFEILRFQTFTTTIFVEFQLGFNSPAACALSIVLVSLGLLVLLGEAGAQPARPHRPGGPAGPAPAGPGAARDGEWSPPSPAWRCWSPWRSGCRSAPSSTGWSTPRRPRCRGRRSRRPPCAPRPMPRWPACWPPFSPFPSRSSPSATAAASGRVIERSTYLVQSLPGLVIALSLVFFAVHYAFRFYQTSELLIVAYAILFFPLALICVLASVAQAPAGLHEMARSLGSRPVEAFRRVTLPLIAPGLAAGFCLVFLSAVTELTATLILIPTGAHTLASQFWNYETNASYGAAAPYAAMLVGIAVVPSYLLTVWFDRRTHTIATIATSEPVATVGRS